MQHDLNIPHYGPPFWMRNGFVQTFIAGAKLRNPNTEELDRVAQDRVIETRDAKLLVKTSHQEKAKGHVILIHGWEGSDSSIYVRSTSSYLFQRGFSISRLNLRDHGNSHHLNPGVFHSNRLSEVQEAAMQLSQLRSEMPNYLIGFSLGGNFALRIARELAGISSHSLKHVFAISPVIDPFNASPIIDKNPLIRRYFLKKWTTSLKKKEAAFPDTYDFSNLYDFKRVMPLSDEFIPKFTPYENSKDYFNGYRIWPDDLVTCDIPTKIITAVDDPIVPVEHLKALNLSPCVKPIILKYGGHNGFFQSVGGPTWYEEYVETVLSKQ